MEIIEFKLSPVVVSAKPWVRTKPKTITMIKGVHCRICTRIAGSAVVHDVTTLHVDTVISDSIIRKAVDIHKESKGQVMKTKLAPKFGVWVNGKLSFSNAEFDVAEGYAHYMMKKDFRSSIWLARIGSFVAP